MSKDSPTVQGDGQFGRGMGFIMGNGLLFYAQTVIPGSDPESVKAKIPRYAQTLNQVQGDGLRSG
ncbi:MAG TPA: hypothetical protein DCZ76_06255 [Treponema sp.]|nr:hypothetical protein [Treponema sp.]